jgi:hypothetical protein
MAIFMILLPISLALLLVSCFLPFQILKNGKSKKPMKKLFNLAVCL